MRRQIIVIFCCLFVFTTGLAAASDAPSAPPRGALFKVEQKGHVAWLFGTIHVGADSFYPLEPTLTEALDTSPVLALEVDPLGSQDDMVRAVREYGMYQNGRGPASAELPAQYRPRLDRLLRQYDVPPPSVAPMKPWMIASLLTVREFESQGYRSDLAVEVWLSRRARERGQKVVELESVGAQMSLFGKLSAADQAVFLQETIDAIEDKEQATDARAIAQAWATADQAALERIAAKTASDATFSGRFVARVLLDGRNPLLADGIVQLLSRERQSVAAIGVLHLVGKGSVPELLRQKGLQVQRIY